MLRIQALGRDQRHARRTGSDSQKGRALPRRARGRLVGVPGLPGAGYARASACEWRDDDPGFAAAWREALETGADLLEDVSTERAFNGSDTQLIFQLKARRPEKYTERARREVHHSGRFAVAFDPEDEGL
jgi:hypothetical protein